MKLYELAIDYRHLQDQADELDPQVLADTLESIGGEIEVKAENIAKLIMSMESTEGAIKAEEKRLADRRRAIENNRKRIKEYIQYQMELAGMPRIKTPTITLAIQNNPPAVEISEQEAIPAKFLTIIPESYVLDKKRIAEALKSGEEVPGAYLRQGQSLRIR